MSYHVVHEGWGCGHVGKVGGGAQTVPYPPPIRGVVSLKRSLERNGCETIAFNRLERAG